MGINLSISDKTLASKPVLVDAFTTAKSKTGRLHFLGLVSAPTAQLSMEVVTLDRIVCVYVATLLPLSLNNRTF